MKVCALAPVQDLYERCDGRIEWHHVFIYASSQIPDAWNIQPACHKHHMLVTGQRAVKAAFEVAALRLATPEDLARYPHKDWQQLKRSLGLPNV